MKTYVMEGVVTALTSISHIGDTHGINAKLRRERIVQPDGSVEEVPIISGNSLRGTLRDLGMYHMLRTLGYGVDEETGEVQGLSLAAFYFLFSGGALTKIAGKAVNIDEVKRIRRLIPLVSVFGGAMGNIILNGKVKIGKMIPICLETKHLIPERYTEGMSTVSIWDMIQEEAYTRRDDEKNFTYRKMIAPETLALIDYERQQKQMMLVDDVVEETGQKQQMRYYVETLAPGTRFYWDIVLEDVSDLEFEAFLITLAEFARQPYIGGKSAVGLGKVSVKFEKWIEIDPRMKVKGNELDVTLGTKYMQHLRQHGREIREVLDGIS